MTSEEEIESKTQEDLDEIWLPLLKTDGQWDSDKIRAELHDLVFIYNQVAEVYMYITGGLLSKAMYYAGVIKQQFDDNISSAVQEELEEFECEVCGHSERCAEYLAKRELKND